MRSKPTCPGGRHLCDIGPLRLENGDALPQAHLAYETWGTLNAERSNAVLVLHALTGDSHVTSSSHDPTPGWWEGIVGEGSPIDTREHFVVAANILGGCHGSTGPSSPAPDGTPWGSRFPLISTRDQVHAEARLADALGIDRWSLVIGASMGGHRALEWAITYPQRVERLIVVASGAQTTADQAAWIHSQLGAIRLDSLWKRGDYYGGPPPAQGLGLARQIAHTTYRSAPELQERFGRFPQHEEDVLEGGRLAIQSYLDHHGVKLANRFDAGSYVALCHAMLTHDVGRDRGGIAHALRSVTARTLVIAVDSDRLFHPNELWNIADNVRGAFYREVHSDHGHDGFLIERDQVARLIREFIDRYRGGHEEYEPGSASNRWVQSIQ